MLRTRESRGKKTKSCRIEEIIQIRAEIKGVRPKKKKKTQRESINQTHKKIYSRLYR